jgi:uncharacterized alpha-E superfamily protein
VQFLLSDVGFPRSVLFSLVQLESLVTRINQYANEGKPNDTSRLAKEILERIQGLESRQPTSTELHDILTDVIESLAGVCEHASRDYFNLRDDSLAS